MRTISILVIAALVLVFQGSVYASMNVYPQPDGNGYVKADTVKIKDKWLSPNIISGLNYKIQVWAGGVKYWEGSSADINFGYDASGVPPIITFYRRYQAQGVPLRPGLVNTVKLLRNNPPDYDVWSEVGSTTLRIDPSYRVYPVRIHLLTLSCNAPCTSWDPTVNGTSNPYNGYPKSVISMFDTYDWPHCSASGVCSTVSNACTPATSPATCATDYNCQSGYSCDTNPLGSGGVYNKNRVCWPNSCKYTWSTDMTVSPGTYLPSAQPADKPYVNCGVAFRVATQDAQGNLVYTTYDGTTAAIDVIGFEDAWKEDFNCGSYALRDQAIIRAGSKNPPTFYDGDGFVHVFLTRSVSLHTDWEPGNQGSCTASNPNPGCTTAGLGGTVWDGAAFVAMESNCSKLSMPNRSLPIAHEIVHLSGISDPPPTGTDNSGRPTNSDLMASSMGGLDQNAHLFSGNTNYSNMCDYFKNNVGFLNLNQ